MQGERKVTVQKNGWMEGREGDKKRGDNSKSKSKSKSKRRPDSPTFFIFETKNDCRSVDLQHNILDNSSRALI